MKEDHEKRSSMKDHKSLWRRIINEDHDGEPIKKIRQRIIRRSETKIVKEDEMTMKRA